MSHTISHNIPVATDVGPRLNNTYHFRQLSTIQNYMPLESQKFSQCIAYFAYLLFP